MPRGSRPPAFLLDPRGPADLAPDGDHAGLERLVVGRDALGEVRRVPLDVRLHEVVLVAGVLDQEVEQAVDVHGQRLAGATLGGVQAPGPAVTRKSSARMPLWMSR